MVKVCIIGAGVTGLTTAVSILEAMPSCDLTIISDKPVESITSWGPPGHWRPYAMGPRDAVRRWSKASYLRFLKIISDPKWGPASGVQMVSGYLVDNDINFLKAEENMYGDIALNFHWLTPDELAMLNKTQYKFGIFYTAVTAEGSVYVPWLITKVNELGAKMKTQHVNNFDELTQYDLIVNCSGLGSRELCHDAAMEPNRGILIKVKAPWFKHFWYYGGDTIYAIVGKDHVYLGGVRQAGRTELNATKEEVEDIWKRLTFADPTLKDAQVTQQWVGLRPYRKGGPRVGLETKQFGGKSTPIVHNYGHAGNGFTLSWGCAAEATELVVKAVRSLQQGKKSQL